MTVISVCRAIDESGCPCANAHTVAGCLLLSAFGPREYCWRHLRGLIPTNRRNILVKCDWSHRPQLSAICDKAVSLVTISSRARSMRRRAT
jgi:hypothetical protein